MATRKHVWESLFDPVSLVVRASINGGIFMSVRDGFDGSE